MKVTLRHKRKVRQNLMNQLIELQCDTYLNKLNNNVVDIKNLIRIVQQNGIIYNKQIGIICAHVAKHYHNSHINIHAKKQNHVIQRLLTKFQILFKHQQQPFTQNILKNEISHVHKLSQAQLSKQNLLNYDQVIDYAKFCIKVVLNDDFLQSIPNQERFDVKLEQIIIQHLKSLLLEYIPIEYSALVLKLYLEESQNQEQEEWMVKNKESNRKLYPFHDIFQIYCSLSYHILHSKKIVDSNHFLMILERPIMGVVEWPMILGVRNIYSLPQFSR